MTAKEIVALIEEHRQMYLDRWDMAVKGGSGSRMNANRESIATLDALLMEIHRKQNPGS